MSKIMMPSTMLPNTPTLGCFVTQFCEWKSLSSVLTVNLLHPHQQYIEQADENPVLVALWFGGTLYFKICIDFLQKQLSTPQYSAVPSSIKKKLFKKKEKKFCSKCFDPYIKSCAFAMRSCSTKYGSKKLNIDHGLVIRSIKLSPTPGLKRCVLEISTIYA